MLVFKSHWDALTSEYDPLVRSEKFLHTFGETPMFSTFSSPAPRSPGRPCDIRVVHLQALHVPGVGCTEDSWKGNLKSVKYGYVFTCLHKLFMPSVGRTEDSWKGNWKVVKCRYVFTCLHRYSADTCATLSAFRFKGWVKECEIAEAQKSRITDLKYGARFILNRQRIV